LIGGSVALRTPKGTSILLWIEHANPRIILRSSVHQRARMLSDGTG
jgi:hypothetical protein